MAVKALLFPHHIYYAEYSKVTCGAVYSKFPTWVGSLNNKLREESYYSDLSLGGYLGVLYYTSDYSGIFIEFGYHNDLLKGVEAYYEGDTFTIDHNVNYYELAGSEYITFTSNYFR